MRCKWMAIAMVVFAVPWARGQQIDPAKLSDPATREMIQGLLSRIDRLEKRVGELEQERAALTAPSPARAATPAPARPATANVHLTHEQVPPPEEAQPVYPSLKISGFGDVDYSATNLHGPNGGFQPETLLGQHSGFSEGQFTLHLSSALSPRVTVFGELTLTGRGDAGQGSPAAPGFNAEVERLIIRYDLNDYFKLSFGRYHTPINYWNTAYHHGEWLQTTISRPEMIQFGGGFLPVHFIGALAQGSIPAGGLNLNYDVGLGNGRAAVLSRGGDIGDINNNRAWLVNAFVKPDFLYGLQIGGSVYRDKLNPLVAPAAREWIEAGHIVWARESPEFIAEFANVSHTPIAGAVPGVAPGAGVASNSQAFYVQTAYRLPGAARLFKPYYRFEYMHIPQADAIFRGLEPSFTASTGGVRYDITTFAAFKLEYRRYQVRHMPDFQGVFLQTSFTF